MTVTPTPQTASAETNHMHQLRKFVEWEREYNPDRCHIAEWALYRIAQLEQQLRIAVEVAAKHVHGLQAERDKTQADLVACLEGQELLKAQTVRIRKALGDVPAEMDTEEAAKRMKADLAAALEDLRSIRAGERATVEYDLSPAMRESAVRDKLIELGWTPPAATKESP